MRWSCARHALVALVGCLSLTPGAALACSYFFSPVVETDPSRVGLDTEPPVLLDVNLVELTRGSGVSDQSDCTDPGVLTLATVAHDDQTPSASMRYRVEVLRGDPPGFPYGQPARDLWFLVFHGPDDPIDFELRLRAVDEAGNESEPFDFVIRDAVPGGCSLPRAPAPSTRGALALFTLACGALGLRRGRRVAE